MRKVFFIIPVLFAYAIILGHNLIPHTHHTHHIEVKHDHDHHHSGHENHDSDDREDESENESENEEGSLPDLFSHFVHSPFTVSIEHTLVLPNEGNEIKNLQSHVFVIEEPYAFAIAITERKLPPDVGHQFYSNYSVRHSSLRAPPIC